MKLKEFDYDVFVIVEISGRELAFLQELSKHHYDGVCKQSGELGGFLYGFIQAWIGMSPSHDYSEFQNRTDSDRTEEFKMKGSELGILAKICEFNNDPNPLLRTSDFISFLRKRKAEYDRINEVTPA